jgi:GNAT superfamily N-acetyltransferase
MRELEAGDRPFVAATWGKSYAPIARKMGMLSSVFYAEHPRVVDATLERADVVVLCSQRVPSTIFGWACGEPGLLHWAYVVPELRGRGVGRRLIVAVTGVASTEAPLVISHRPARLSQRLVFNPYRIHVA